VTDRVLANRPGGPVAVPELVRAFARDVDSLDAVWLNELGGLTFRDGDRYLKWNPLDSGVDLDDERARLAWAAPRHPVPEILDFGRDGHGQLLVTRALNGTGVVTEEWRARSREAVRVIAEGLRLLQALPVENCPFVCDWARNDDNPPADLVVVQGDPRAPNLAVASMSLDWNFGSGWQTEFFAAYGIAPDVDRIRLYRALWDAAP
jgi:kanamycin kinase